MEKLTLIAAVRKHLALPEEGIAELASGFKRLTDKDKADLRDWFPLADPPVEIVEPVR